MTEGEVEGEVERDEESREEEKYTVSSHAGCGCGTHQAHSMGTTCAVSAPVFFPSKLKLLPLNTHTHTHTHTHTQSLTPVPHRTIFYGKLDDISAVVGVVINADMFSEKNAKNTPVCLLHPEMPHYIKGRDD